MDNALFTIHSDFAGGYNTMPNGSLMDYCLLFTGKYLPSYDLYSSQWEAYMNIPLQDGRRETYALNVAGGHSGAESARLAGYCPNNPQNARVMSWYLLKRSDVQDRIAQLREAASDDAILSLIQMKQVLSQIGRACLKDYQDEDGHFRPLNKNSPNPSAVAEVVYKYDPVRREPYPVRIRLHDAVGAIVELCRLDGLYKKRPMMVSLAPIMNADATRSKLLARIERPRSGAIESNDIGSRGEDRCLDVPLLAEHIDTKNSDKEVTHGTRKPRARGKT